MKETVLDANDIKRIFPWFKNDKIINALLRWLHVSDTNALHAANCHKRGADFSDSIVEGIGAKLVIDNEEVLKNLPEGSFVTVSNHPFGALDGIIIISMFARYRPEYKVMVNQFLTCIGAMCDNFISVEPVSSSEKAKAVSMNGIRTAIKHVREGNPIGFFPAGAVSKLKLDLTTEDREWQSSIVRLIKQFKKPVIPVYFYGRNSIMFYFLRSINYLLSSLRLPTEVFNKKGKTIHIAIGQPIMPEEYEHIEDIEELGKFLKSKSYELRKK